MAVVASGVGGTDGAGVLVTVRRENMKLNIVGGVEQDFIQADA